MEVNLDEPENTVHSMKSEEKAYIRFVNESNRDVEIVWINFTGQFVRYKLLPPRSYVNVNTYKTHPWIALDYASRDRMCIDGKFVYMPEPWVRQPGENPNLFYPIVPDSLRKRTSITLPLYSLRYRCLLAVRDIVKTVEGISALDLPKLLSDDLRRVIELKERSVTTPIVTFA